MILSSDGLVYGLCALMCGGVAALDGYAQFGNLEREAQYRVIVVRFFDHATVTLSFVDGGGDGRGPVIKRLDSLPQVMVR